MNAKPLVLILCTGNSCRSHLAEGFLRQFAGDVLEVASAGSRPAGYVHPLAIQVMREAGVDISAHTSKHMDEFLTRRVETVITVCGNADQACPLFPGQVNRHHWPFEDPAHATGTDEEKLAVFRRVRDEIKARFQNYANGRKDPCMIYPNVFSNVPFVTPNDTKKEKQAALLNWSKANTPLVAGYQAGRRDARCAKRQPS